MYLHECYLIPAPALNAVVEYLKERPYKEAAPLLEALNGHPNGSATGLQKAGIGIDPQDHDAFGVFINWQYHGHTGTPEEFAEAVKAVKAEKERKQDDCYTPEECATMAAANRPPLDFNTALADYQHNMNRALHPTIPTPGETVVEFPARREH